jgi:hypothetical protein
VLTVAGWTFVLYVALKLCHLMLGRKVAADGVEIPPATRLRAGEPALLIGTVTVAALLVAYTGWWSHKFHAHIYARALACYPAFAAAPLLPAAPARFRSYDAAERVRRLQRAAEEHGVALGVDEAAVDRLLKQAWLAHARRYAAVRASGDRAGIASAYAELDRCEYGGGVRGEFLHPV